MSFNIEDLDRHNFDRDKGTAFFVLLHDAEKNLKKGQKEITVEKPQLWDFNPFIGQIFHWKTYEEKDPQLKHIWRLVSGTDNTVRKMVGGGTMEDSAGTLTFEKAPKDYLPKKDKFIVKREAEELVFKAGFGLYKEGVFLISKSGDYARVKQILIGEAVDNDLSNESPLNNPHQIDIMKDCVFVVVEHEQGSENRVDVENPEFKAEKKYTLDQIEKLQTDWQVIPENSLKDFEDKINTARETQSLEVFGEKLMITGSDEESLKQAEETSNALMGLSNTEQLEVIRREAAVNKNQASVVQSGFVRVIVLQKEDFEVKLNKERERMELMKDDLERQITVFKKQMRKIHRLIVTLEIYLGEGEAVVQISEGEKAPEEDPICLRQLMLYMDEEFGDPADGGLDFESIEDFDEWLVDSGNFKKVVPESKCVVVMQPRRKDKRYEVKDRFDAIATRAKNDANKLLYILIRNGDNLYRIFSDNVDLGNRLFPLRDEFQAMVDQLLKAQVERHENEQDSYKWRNADNTVDEMDNKIFHYKRNFILLQGLVLRTEVFAPVPTDLNLLEVDTHKGRVKFIYDEENILQDGEMRYTEWHSYINSHIQKGSRISVSINGYPSNFKSRYGGYYSDYVLNNFGVPPQGVYEVYSRKVGGTSWKTEYIPEEEWKANELAHMKFKEKHKKVTDYGDGRTHTQYNLPKDYNRGYKFAHYRNYKDKTVCVYVLDEKGDKISVDKRRDELYIKFTYETWKGKKRGKSFIIKPTDGFVLNYDALEHKTITYYLNSRLDRVNYVDMIPVLRGLRKNLKDENVWEENFVVMTKHQILTEHPTLEKLDIDQIIWDAVDWWKHKLPRIYKRAISKDDAKALEKISQRVKKMCNQLYKTGLDVGSNYKKRTLVWPFEKYVFYGTGVSKKEFAQQVKEIKASKFTFRYSKGFSKVADQVRAVNDPTLTELANMKKGEVQFKQKT